MCVLLSLRQSGFVFKHRLTCVHARLLGPCYKTGQVFTDTTYILPLKTSLTVRTCAKRNCHVFAKNTHTTGRPSNSRKSRTCTASPKALHKRTRPVPSHAKAHDTGNTFALRTSRRQQRTRAQVSLSRGTTLNCVHVPRQSRTHHKRASPTRGNTRFPTSGFTLFELSLQSPFQLSLTLLVRYRSRSHI